MTPKYEEHFICTGLDLEPILFKMCSKHSRGGGWDINEARRVEELYRKWLFLHVLFPEERLVPSKEIDEMWHYHILDTLKYKEDCERMFGRFLHHFPYSGMLNKEDERQHKEAFERTKELFAQVYGEQYAEEALCMSGYCDDITHLHSHARVRPTLDLLTTVS